MGKPILIDKYPPGAYRLYPMHDLHTPLTDYPHLRYNPRRYNNICGMIEPKQDPRWWKSSKK